MAEGVSGLPLCNRTEEGRDVRVTLDVGLLCEVQVTAVRLALACKRRLSGSLLSWNPSTATLIRPPCLLLGVCLLLGLVLVLGFGDFRQTSSAWPLLAVAGPQPRSPSTGRGTRPRRSPSWNPSSAPEGTVRKEKSA